MKIRITILLIFLSLYSFGQIKVRKDWPKSIQKEFNSIINEKNVDTVLVYYAYLGPWTILSDSCNSISTVWVLWKKNKRFYYQQLSCKSTVGNKTKEFSGKSFEYFQIHRKAYKLQQEYFKKAKSISIETDGTDEYLIYMTKHNYIPFSISNWQRTEKEWNSLEWVKDEIRAIDTTKKELKIE